MPSGFVVDRVAAPPLVEHPMCAGFDDHGRLFVAENAGVNVNFHELSANPPSKVLMLEDTNGDGVFDKRTVFADKMNFPTGALWLDGVGVQRGRDARVPRRHVSGRGPGRRVGP